MAFNKILKYLFLWLSTSMIIALCWVGAEVIVEGVVHSSKVDSVICAMLGWYMVQEVMRDEREKS